MPTDRCEENWPLWFTDMGRRETAGYESILLMNQSSVATIACRLGHQTSGIFTQKDLENQNVLFTSSFCICGRLSEAVGWNSAGQVLIVTGYSLGTVWDYFM